MFFLSVLLSVFSMPGFLWGGFIWVSLIPLFISLQKKSLIKGTFTTYFFGVLFLSITHYWLLPVLSVNVPEVLMSFPGYIGIICYFLMGLVMALPYLGIGFSYVLLRDKLKDRPIIFSLYVSSIFTIFEFLRSVGPLGFTGGRFSDALASQTGILQILSIGGSMLGVFLIVFVNALIYSLWLKYKNKKIMILAVVILVVFSVNGIIQQNIPFINYEKESMDEIVGIQTNVPQSLKYNTDIKESYNIILKSLEEVNNGSIVAFPEGTFMFDIRNSLYEKDFLNLIKDKNLKVLVGFPRYEKESYNQIGLYTSEGVEKEFYAKIRLTPFAETLPFPKILGVFEFLKFLDFYEPGKEFTVFKIDDNNIGAQICYDSYYSEVSRGLVNNGAEVLLTLTNDGWFNKTGRLQHSYQSMFRAIENGKYMIQVANTGITAIYDPYGRMLKKLPTIDENSSNHILSTFSYIPIKEKSFYTRYGEWIVYLSIIMAVTIFIYSLFIKRNE